MAVIATGFIPLLLLSVVSTMVMWESRQSAHCFVMLCGKAGNLSIVSLCYMGKQANCPLFCYVMWESRQSVHCFVMLCGKAGNLSIVSLSYVGKQATFPLFHYLMWESRQPVHCFVILCGKAGNLSIVSLSYAGKKPVAWKEYCAKYSLKKLQESMDECTGCQDMTEITLKTAYNQSENGLTRYQMTKF